MYPDDNQIDLSQFSFVNSKGEAEIDPKLDLALLLFVGKNLFANEETYKKELINVKKRLLKRGVSPTEIERLNHIIGEFSTEKEKQEVADGKLEPHMAVLEIMSRHF